jgi:hypothetical protein
MDQQTGSHREYHGGMVESTAMALGKPFAPA